MTKIIIRSIDSEIIHECDKIDYLFDDLDAKISSNIYIYIILFNHIEINRTNINILEKEKEINSIIELTLVKNTIDYDFLDKCNDYITINNNLDIILNYILENTKYVINLFNKYKYGSSIYNDILRRFSFDIFKNNIYLTSNKTFMQKAILLNINNIKYLNNDLYNDIEFINLLYNDNYLIFKLLPIKLRDNEDFVINKVANRAIIYRYLSSRLKSNKEIVISAISNRGYCLCNAPVFYRKDKNIVLIAAKNHPDGLKYADDDLKNDTNFFLEVLKFQYKAYQYGSDRIKSSRQITLKAIKINGLIFEYVIDKFKSDQTIIFEAIKKNSYPAEFINEKLLKDNNFLSKAIEINVDIVRNISKYINDVEIFSKIIKINSSLIGYPLSEKIRNDISFAFLIVNYNGSNICYLSDEFKKNKDLINIAVNNNGSSIICLLDELNNKDLVITAINTNKDNYDTCIYKHISIDLKNDKDIIKLALEKDKNTIRHIALDLFDEDNILIAIHNNNDALKYIPSRLINNDIIKLSLELDGSSIVYVPREYRTKENIIIAAKTYDCVYNYYHFLIDKEFILNLVSVNGLIIKLLPSNFKEDYLIVKTAIKQNIEAKKYISDNYLYILEITKKILINKYINYFSSK